MHCLPKEESSNPLPLRRRQDIDLIQNGHRLLQRQHPDDFAIFFSDPEGPAMRQLGIDVPS